MRDDCDPADVERVLHGWLNSWVVLVFAVVLGLVALAGMAERAWITSDSAARAGSSRPASPAAEV